MDHVFLVPILVCLHVVFLPDSASELPPPELSVQPKYRQYYEGEKVELSCVAKINKTVGGYRFFDPSGPLASELVINGLSGLLYVTLQREKDETYRCEYWLGDDTRVTSQQSNNITFQVKELPPPELSVQPKYRQYYEGEKVELSCVAKISKIVGGYRFFDSSGPVASELVINGYVSGLLYVTLQRKRDETYFCEYWMGSDTEVTSHQSSNITLQVKEAPKKPSLTLNHTLPQYKWQDYMTLVCSAPPEAKNITEFQYLGDRQTIQALKPLNNTDRTDIYDLKITEPKGMRNFCCIYIQSFSGRKVRSKKSDPVFIDPAVSGWGRILATGGAFFTINGLIFLISHCHFLPKVSK